MSLSRISWRGTVLRNASRTVGFEKMFSGFLPWSNCRSRCSYVPSVPVIDRGAVERVDRGLEVGGRLRRDDVDLAVLQRLSRRERVGDEADRDLLDVRRCCRPCTRGSPQR